jgi:hypothetical protein
VETLHNCWWKSGLFPDLIPAPPHRKEQGSRKRVVPLNPDEVVVEADSEAPAILHNKHGRLNVHGLVGIA